MAKLRKNPPSDFVLEAGPSQALSSSPGMQHRSSTSSAYYTPSRPLPMPSAYSSTSRTMAYARAQTDSYQVMSKTAGAASVPLAGRNLNQAEESSFAASLVPRTISEQYWAVRALVAEVRLSEREGYQADAYGRAQEEERRRHLAIDAAHKVHEDRVARLERLIIGLISTIVFISIFLLFRQQNHPTDKASKSAFRPHLTIPILSPFTSIVENEDSKFSFRTTAVFLIVLGILAYALLRHWLHRRQR